jgi:hypothetical protein
MIAVLDANVLLMFKLLKLRNSFQNYLCLEKFLKPSSDIR